MTNRRNEKYHEFTMKIARPGLYVRATYFVEIDQFGK